MDTTIGISEIAINGLLFPFLLFDASNIRPRIGSVTASHAIAMEEMVPAIAGLIPAIVVRKKDKNDITML